MSKPMSKRVRLAPGQERSVTVRVRSLRNPPLDVRLSSQPLSTSLLDVKASVSAETGVPVDKIKLLHSKKPVPDSKILRDLVPEGESSLELSAMILGGAAAMANLAVGKAAGAANAGAATAPNTTAQGLSGEAVLQTDQFWSDLRGFLLQRIRDEKITEELFAQFLSSWESKR
jgi:hypothetical protein